MTDERNAGVFASMPPNTYSKTGLAAYVVFWVAVVTALIVLAMWVLS